MTAEDRGESRLEQIVEVRGTSDETVPSTTRVLAASGVTVVVVATVLLGAPVLAAGLLLVALAVAIATTGDEVAGARDTVQSLEIGELVARFRAWLEEMLETARTRIAGLPERTD